MGAPVLKTSSRLFFWVSAAPGGNSSERFLPTMSTWLPPKNLAEMEFTYWMLSSLSTTKIRSCAASASARYLSSLSRRASSAFFLSLMSSVIITTRSTFPELSGRA